MADPQDSEIYSSFLLLQQRKKTYSVMLLRNDTIFRIDKREILHARSQLFGIKLFKLVLLVSLLSNYEVIRYPSLCTKTSFYDTLPPKRNRWSRSDQSSNDCLGSSTKTPNCRPIMFAHNRATFENEFSKTAILAY